MRTIALLTGRNLRIFFRDRSGVFFSLLSALLLYGLYALLLSNLQVNTLTEQLPSAHPDDIQWFVNVWVFAGITMITTVTTGLASLGVFVDDRGSGRFSDFVVAPLRRWQLIVGYVVSSFIVSMIMTLIVVLAGLLLIVLGLSSLVVRAGQAVWAAAANALSTRAAVTAAGPDAPVLLSMPGIGIDHQLVPGGLSESGAIDPDQGEVIWYDGGGRAVPGAQGIAVIAAHVDYYGEPDVFADLAEVEVGQELSITQQDGDVLELTVVETKTMGKDELRTSDLVWGQENERRLVALVTCDDALGVRPDGHRVANFVALAEVSG